MLNYSWNKEYMEATKKDKNVFILSKIENEDLLKKENKTNMEIQQNREYIVVSKEYEDIVDRMLNYNKKVKIEDITKLFKLQGVKLNQSLECSNREEEKKEKINEYIEKYNPKIGIESIKIENLIKEALEYIRIEDYSIDEVNKKIEIKIKNKVTKEIIIEEIEYNINTYKKLKDLEEDDKKEKEEEIKKEYALQKISKNPLDWEILVKGSDTYYSNFYKETLEIRKKSDLSIRKNWKKSNFLEKEEDIYTLKEEEYKSLKNTYIKLIDKLGLGSFPLEVMNDSTYDAFSKGTWEIKMLEDNPELFEKLLNENEIYNYIVKFYEYLHINQRKYLEKKILNKEEYKERLNNPLLKLNSKKLNLYTYEINAVVLKSDGDEIYETNISKRYISKEKLDEEKLKELFEKENDYDVYRFDSINFENLGKTNGRDLDTYIEINKKDKRYISRPSNHRFKESISKAKAKEDLKVNI